jgi:8-oxo-dGTP pyrophosphatase MutT (NUDIX family)
MNAMRTRQYQASGGVVLDDAARVLLIERDVVRDEKPVHEVRLPKGRVEPGETDEQTALREVCEETGYCDLRIVADLGTSRVEFDRGDKHVIRIDHFYLMRLASDRYTGQNMAPHKEEALFKPRWVADLAEAKRRLTYDSEKQFAARAIAWTASH